GEDPEAAGQGNGTGGGQRTATRERRRSPLVTTLLILVVVGIAASLIAQFWTEVLWFDSVRFRPVFLTELGAKVLLGVVGGLINAGILGARLHIGYPAPPPPPPAGRPSTSATAPARSTRPRRRTRTRSSATAPPLSRCVASQ